MNIICLRFIPGISLVYTSALPLLIVTVVSNGAYRFLACSQYAEYADISFILRSTIYTARVRPSIKSAIKYLDRHVNHSTIEPCLWMSKLQYLTGLGMNGNFLSFFIMSWQDKNAASRMLGG